MNASELKPVVFESLKSIIDHIEKGGSDEVDSILTAIKNYGKLEGKAGGAAIAAQLGLNDQELTLFDGAVCDVGRKFENLNEATEGPSRNTFISILRYFSWIETIASRVSAITVPSGYEAAISEDMGRKQIRALELIVCSLVGERFGDQDTLEPGLTDVFKPEVLEKWKKSGDQGFYSRNKIVV